MIEYFQEAMFPDGTSKMIASRNNLGTIGLALMLSLFAAGCKKKPPVVATHHRRRRRRKAEAEAGSAGRLGVRSRALDHRARSGRDVALESLQACATDIKIEPGIGAVNASGSRQVFPGNTTTYTLTATGPGGSNSRTATVNVTQLRRRHRRRRSKPNAASSDWLAQDVQDALLRLRQQHDSRRCPRRVVSRCRGAEVHLCEISRTRSSAWKVTPTSVVRPSTTWVWPTAAPPLPRNSWCNWAFRADRLKPVSYGKERPQCTESNEGCWQRNRRAHFAVGQ